MSRSSTCKGGVTDISYVMLAAARAFTQQNGGKVVGVLLGSGAQALAQNLAADQILYFDQSALAEFNPDAYQRVLVDLIRQKEPRAVLFGSTSIGADIASVLSARLNLPQVSSCLSLGADEKFTSKICGGKIMVEGELPVPTAVITMIPGGFKPEEGQSAAAPEIITMPAPALDNLRVSLKTYIEPDTSDVDISTEPILIAIGRGVQTEDNIELADELAELLGGTVCASRPVVDQGWMPTSRLVGKSGKSVKPNIYLALGISGAPEHVEGIAGGGTVIAVNTDPNAPIFDVAQYGADIDMLDLLEVLIEQVEEAKG